MAIPAVPGARRRGRGLRGAAGPARGPGRIGLATRLAVWGLVAASSIFNWTHAPHRPAAPEAFGLMPAAAALLFEFCLRELRLRTLADQAGRKLSALGWLRPAERIRVQLCLATGEQASAEAATRHVRVSHAAKRLYQLRIALAFRGERPGSAPWHETRRTGAVNGSPRTSQI